MALTIVVNPDYEKLTGKVLSIQAELNSRIRTAIIDVTYTAEDYDIGGNIVDLSLDGRVSTIISCEVMETSIGVVGQYVPGAGNAATLGKLKLYEAGTASSPLDEVDDADAITATFKFRIVGF